MTHSAMIALEQDCDEEGKSPVSAEASLTESVGNLMSFMPSIADQFMMSVQSATDRLTERVGERDLTPQEIQSAKNAFVAAMFEAGSQLMSQRQWLVDEIQSLDGLWQGKVLAKIKETQAAVEAEELRIRALTDDDAVDLSTMMRSITLLNEKKSYLIGLRFQIPDNLD